MFRKSVIVVLALLLCVCARASAEEKKEKENLFDMIKKPVKAIFAPIEGGDLIDLILEPAEAVLAPVLGLGEVAVTPGRTREYVFNVNKNISVINADDIRETNAQYVQQVIDKASGVILSGYFGNTKDSSVDMRGFGEAGMLNYVLLIDGRRTNQIDLSGADLSLIDVHSIDRIEIIRGANSVLYGDNAAGGVINIITKKATADHHIEYIQELGSYQYHKEYITSSGAHPFLDYFFSYSYQDSDGYRLNNSYEADDALGNVTIKPADFCDTVFSFGYHRDWYGMPGAMYPGNIQNDGREGSRSPDSKAKTEDWYFAVDPRVFGKWGEHEAVFSSFLSYRSRRMNSRDVSSWATYETNHHIASWDFRPKCEVNSSFFQDLIENKLVFGMDYFRADDEVLSGDITMIKSQVDIVKETFGIYMSDNMLMNKRFILSGGVRGEWAKYNFDQLRPAASIDTRSPEEIAFDAGAGYKYNEKSQVYASYARSYRYPTTDEYFQSAYESWDFDWNTFTMVRRVFPAVLNIELKHQVSNNVEIGVKDNSFDFLATNVSYYLIDTKKEIYYDPTTWQNTNYGQVVRHGLELETRLNVFDKVNAFFAYTFQKAFFVGDRFASKTVPMVPKAKISAGVDIKPFEGLDANLTVDYLGSRFILSDQMNDVSKLKSHVTVDLNLSYEVKNIRLFGSIRNLLGEKYCSSAVKNWQGNPAFYPAPERNFEWGVSCKF